MDGTEDYPPIDENIVWADTVGSSYKNCIYGMGTYYANGVSLSLVSVSGTSIKGPAADDEVYETVFKLNAKLQA